jgi:hypothetical protein
MLSGELRHHPNSAEKMTSKCKLGIDEIITTPLHMILLIPHLFVTVKRLTVVLKNNAMIGGLFNTKAQRLRLTQMLISSIMSLSF